MDIPSAIIIAGSTALVTGGVAWGSVKQALNGTRAAVEETKQEVKEILHENHNFHERLVKVETKIDILLEEED